MCERGGGVNVKLCKMCQNVFILNDIKVIERMDQVTDQVTIRVKTQININLIISFLHEYFIYISDSHLSKHIILVPM